MIIKLNLLLLMLIGLFMTGCMDRATSYVDCEVGYTGSDCTECVQNYIKQSKYCIYDCTNIENVDKVNDTNNGCICKEGYVFDSATRACKENARCESKIDCSSGEICLNNKCVDGCESKTDCSVNQICLNNKCVTGCTDKGDCSAGEICLANKCIDGCDDKTDCSDGEICLDNKCITGCETNGNCNIGNICVANKCIEGCETDRDCDANEVCDIQTKKCKKEEEEVDCRMGDTCEQGYECEQLTGKCILTTDCITNEDCAIGFQCYNLECVARTSCTINDECNEGEICKADGYCDIDTGCNSDEYCINKDPTKPACNINSGRCYECISDIYCSANTEKPVCDIENNICVAELGLCQTDDDCGLNRECLEDGTCISKYGTECVDDSECSYLSSGSCLEVGSPNRCYQCFQNHDCGAGRICNKNTYLCEDMGSGIACADNSECNMMAGEECVEGQCYNPNGNSSNNLIGFCDLEYGGSYCIGVGGTCNGEIMDCYTRTGDFNCGDCVLSPIDPDPDTCNSNADCEETGYCDLNSNRCATHYINCNDDPVDNIGCSNNETCLRDEIGTYCSPNNGKELGETCGAIDDCLATLGCVGNSNDGYKCVEYCRLDSDCAGNYTCSIFNQEDYGYCN